MIRFKMVKPAPFQGSKIEKILYKAVEKTVDEAKKDFEVTTDTWETRVLFSVRVVSGMFFIRGVVWTDNQIYGYVNDGTKKHTIRAKRAKALRFQGGYKAKTVVGVLGSRGGGSFGETVYRQQVKHPGNKGRKFDKLVKKQANKYFPIYMRQAMKEVAESTGHAL